MHRSRTPIVALGLALVGALLDVPGHSVAMAAPRPDIVVFYLDDWSPYPRRLWDDPDRTPNLAGFVNSGLTFASAVASTPLCGPARANLLTGKVSHNNGVTQNNVKPYDQRGTISPKLRSRGYRTAFVGKYINRTKKAYWNRTLLGRLSDDWDRFDIMLGARFYDWRQYRKSGNRRYGSSARDHSSFQAAKRAVNAIKTTKRNKRLFMVVSLYDGHAPLTPMKRFEGHPACADVGGWSGPAYDEADVSDKPSWVRARARLERDSYALRARCESLLTADWVVGRVVKALREHGRHDNTLQVLTADNGWLMGDHRLTGKRSPYSTSVPLYMRWPRVLGSGKRAVREPVSNVDLAPTFCAIAGCTIKGADGRSLLPLIKRTKTRLDRKFVWVEYLHNAFNYNHSSAGRPGWAGVETTLRFDSKTLWSYVRYRTGEEELYDLTADPHRLENLARRPAYRSVRDRLRRSWRTVWRKDGVQWRAKSDNQ